MREREDLETTGIGDERPALTAHEGMQPTRCLDDVWPGMHHQVICVGKLQLDATSFSLAIAHTLERTIRSNWHESRCIYDTMRRVYATDSCLRHGMAYIESM